MKELIDKQYLFRHRDQENITRSQDLEVIALNSFLKYVRTCPALLIAIGNPKNIQEAVEATEKYEPDLDIAEVDEEKSCQFPRRIHTAKTRSVAKNVRTMDMRLFTVRLLNAFIANQQCTKVQNVTSSQLT